MSGHAQVFGVIGDEAAGGRRGCRCGLLGMYGILLHGMHEDPDGTGGLAVASYPGPSRWEDTVIQVGCGGRGNCVPVLGTARAESRAVSHRG